MKFAFYFPLVFVLFISFGCKGVSTELVSVPTLKGEPEVVLTTGHNDQVNDIDISPNGRFFATGANNNIIKIWDVPTSREFRTLSDCDGRIVRVKWSPDNIHVAALLYSDEIKVWNAITGETVAVYEANSSARTIDFTKDGKQVVFFNDDAHLTLGNVSDSIVEVVNKEYGFMGILNQKKNIAYVLNHQGKVFTVDLNSKTKTDEWQLFPQANFPFTNFEIDEKTGFVACGFNDDMVYVLDVPNKKIVFKSKKMASKIQDVSFRKGTDEVFASDHLGNFATYNYKTGKEQTKKGELYKRAQKFCFHPNGTYYIQASHNLVEIVNADNGNVLDSYKARVEKIQKMSLSAKGRFLATAKSNVNIDVWDLTQNRVVRNLQGFFPCQFTNENSNLISMHFSLKLVMWNVKNGKILKEFDTDKELVQVLAVSADGSKLAAAGFAGIVRVWDVKSGKVLHKLTGHQGGIYGLDFSPDGTVLASSGMDKTVRVWNLKTGKEITQLSNQEIIISDVQFSPDGKILASSAWDKTIQIYNTSDWSLKQTLKGHASVVVDLDFSKDGKFLASSGGNSVVTKRDNSVIVWDVATGKKVTQYQEHTDQVFRVEFDGDSHRLYSGSNDGTFVLYDVDKKEKIATYLSTVDSDFLILTPDNYYMGSKEALSSVSFRIDDKLFPLEQFDLRLNRPDIVAKRIGKTSPGLIKAYEYIHKKRLKKMGLKEEDLDGGFVLPEIKFLDKTKLPLVTDDEYVTVKYATKDENHKVDRVNIVVNGVPIYGLSGIDHSSLKDSEITDEVRIPLINGVNDIRISCLNNKGTESLYDRVKIIKKDSGEKGNLFLITIGVSNYQDNRFNLTYPSKDASDIVSSLGESTTLYDKVFVKQLTNEQASKDNILQLKEFLKDAKHTDAVILFVAGHGVLDENFDYYFGTYDMNFDSPAEKGLPYDELEKLLSEAKALKKLLIMDTCHSGEVDKDELEQDENNVPEPEGDIEFRTAGAGVRKKEGLGSDNSAELVKNLFSDLRKGSGATVISSAGGAEYAMESAEWKNGLFTYCLLNGLKQKSADYNRDSKIQLSEIQKYVYESVSRLSNGKQRPTARQENIYLDYYLY